RARPGEDRRARRYRFGGGPRGPHGGRGTWRVDGPDPRRRRPPLAALRERRADRRDRRRRRRPPRGLRSTGSAGARGRADDGPVQGDPSEGAGGYKMTKLTEVPRVAAKPDPRRAIEEGEGVL